MCAWSAPATAVTGDVVTAAFWNTNGRDNLNYLKGTTGLTIIEGTLCVENSTSVFKTPLTRQGGNANTWYTPGTNSYIENGAFIQCGVLQATCPSTDWLSAAIQLPVQLTTYSAVHVGIMHSTPTPPYGAFGATQRPPILMARVASTALVQIVGYNANIGSSWPLNTYDIGWIVIGK